MVECEYYMNGLNVYLNKVLIDTWWNVNMVIPVHAAHRSFGFNRYMVECEFINYYNFFYGTCVLIDTWWNVNFDTAA